MIQELGKKCVKKIEYMMLQFWLMKDLSFFEWCGFIGCILFTMVCFCIFPSLMVLAFLIANPGNDMKDLLIGVIIGFILNIIAIKNGRD